MGSVIWKGEAMYAGYRIRIGDKEVELDNRVDSSQLPTSMEELRLRDVDHDISRLDLPQPRPLENATVEHDTAVIPSTKNFVAPASFYGVAKPKPRGPL